LDELRYDLGVDSKEILVALRRITRAIDLHSKKLERQVGLTVPQILILQAVDEEGSLSVKELARRVSLSQATVTSVLDRLVKKDLVQRERNLTDRRSVSILLTREGKAQIENAPELLQEDFISSFEQLEPWEQKMLTSAVERIAAIMDAEKVDAAPILQVGDITPKQ
jgi:DNA-binding MarR family transcriptional regulator